MFTKFMCICLFLNFSTKGASNSFLEGFFYNPVNFGSSFSILSHSNLQVPFEVLITSFVLLLLLKCALLCFFNLCPSLFSFPNSVLVRDVEEHATESFSLASLRNFNGRQNSISPAKYLSHLHLDCAFSRPKHRSHFQRLQVYPSALLSLSTNSDHASGPFYLPRMLWTSESVSGVIRSSS